MSDKARRVPARPLDMRETVANARSDIGALSKDEFLADAATAVGQMRELMLSAAPVNGVDLKALIDEERL